MRTFWLREKETEEMKRVSSIVQKDMLNQNSSYSGSCHSYFDHFLSVKSTSHSMTNLIWSHLTDKLLAFPVRFCPASSEGFRWDSPTCLWIFWIHDSTVLWICCYKLTCNSNKNRSASTGAESALKSLQPEGPASLTKAVYRKAELLSHSYVSLRRAQVYPPNFHLFPLSLIRKQHICIHHLEHVCVAVLYTLLVSRLHGCTRLQAALLREPT